MQRAILDSGAASGRHTVAAMQAGLVRGHAHLVRGLIQDVQTEIGRQAQVIVTGGHATALLPALGEGAMHIPDLTLDGIRLIYARNQGAGQT